MRNAAFASRRTRGAGLFDFSRFRCFKRPATFAAPKTGRAGLAGFCFWSAPLAVIEICRAKDCTRWTVT